MTANTGLSTPAAATSCCSMACSCFSMETADSPVIPASARRLVVVVVVRVMTPWEFESTNPLDPVLLIVVVLTDEPSIAIPAPSMVLSIGSILLPVTSETPPSILVVVLTVSDLPDVVGTRLVMSIVARVSGISIPVNFRLKVGTPISMSTLPSTLNCRDRDMSSIADAVPPEGPRGRRLMLIRDPRLTEGAIGSRFIVPRGRAIDLKSVSTEKGKKMYLIV